METGSSNTSLQGLHRPFRDVHIEILHDSRLTAVPLYVRDSPVAVSGTAKRDSQLKLSVLTWEKAKESDL